ncbi:type II secretion system protein [Anaerorhabdus sp.]|uniref:type II secretion system protein n=2 Tax=Anaerorhabdus sp. TaxID=1872524 RepID=UPI002FCBD61E
MNKLKKGFTLVELIVVIAVLAVLGMLIVPQVTGAIDESQRVTCMNNLNLIHRAYLNSRASDESLSMSTVITNTDGKYYLGKGECPKFKTTYKPIYLDNVSCTEHKISTIGTLTEYDIYIADKMDELLNDAKKCALLATKPLQNQCIYDLTNGKINIIENIRNDTLRAALFERNGGTWLAIEKEVINAAVEKAKTLIGGVFSEGKYYYQPFFSNKTNVEILFASTDNTTKSSWNANLFFFEGTWYMTAKPDGGILPQGTDGKSAAEIRAMFNDKSKFTVLDYNK